MSCYDYMIIKLWKEGNSLRETGRRLGISKDKVRRALIRHNFETARQGNETARQGNETARQRNETSQNPSQNDGKGRGRVGGKLVFLTLALILIGCLIYIIYTYLEKRGRDRQNSEKPKIKKTFGFGGRSVEELQESTGFILPGEDIPDDEF